MRAWLLWIHTYTIAVPLSPLSLLRRCIIVYLYYPRLYTIQYHRSLPSTKEQYLIDAIRHASILYLPDRSLYSQTPTTIGPSTRHTLLVLFRTNLRRSSLCTDLIDTRRAEQVKRPKLITTPRRSDHRDISPRLHPFRRLRHPPSGGSTASVPAPIWVLADHR